ncbi:MAG: DUF4982 domain-containing protein [Muribaculaceae bacterium]|nr:DUF4982 domain-containing protein [Muribaculaceae bacterium]
MLRLRAIVIVCLCLSPLSLLARDKINFNSGWQFRYLDNPTDTVWKSVDLPHDFLISQPWVAPSAEEKGDSSNQMANIVSRLSSRGFKEMGKGIYRKTFLPDMEWSGRRVLIDFEGIMLRGDAYLNGERIGGTDYGYLGFESDISKALKYGEENVIEVICDTGQPENSRWYTGGGLYRDVNVIITDPDSYFTRNSIYVTTPEIKDDRAMIVVEGELALKQKQLPDSVDIRIKILDQKGAAVYDQIKKHRLNKRQRVREFTLDSVTLQNIERWDIDNPYLYTLEATVFDKNGNPVDMVSKRFGIRQIEFSPEFGFKLNGKKVLLKGIANHHTLGALGAAAYPRAMEKRLDLLKEFGFNHVRTSHNPYSESFLDLCDEKGILVVDELYDKWTTQYAGGRKDWNEQWLHDVLEWVKRDRNHPSVVMWSLGNELQLIPDLSNNDWGVTPYKLQKTLLNRYDTTRPVTVAMHPRGRNEFTDSLPAPLVMETDIAAYNYRYMYFPGDGQKFPWMIFYQSEANASGIPSNYYEMDLDKVVGLAYWGAIDYLGESKGWPAKGWTEGMIDISLQPKPLAYLVKSYFKPDEPLVHIGIIESDEERVWNDVAVGTMQLSENWNRQTGDTVNLYTFTNGDSVELFLNGKSLGKRKNDTSDTKKHNRILWENVPYKEGEVKAVAFDSLGKKIAEHKISTAGKSRRLKLEADNPKWQANGKDLQHVVVSATDNKGIINPTASELLTFEVDGSAEIVGVINGDMNSDELFTPVTSSNGKKALRSLYQGKATVILRSSNESGPVILKVGSDSYPSKTISLELHKPETLR